MVHPNAPQIQAVPREAPPRRSCRPGGETQESAVLAVQRARQLLVTAERVLDPDPVAARRARGDETLHRARPDAFERLVAIEAVAVVSAERLVLLVERVVHAG